MIENQKGITLTILIVTIIIMLILASVIMSINMSLNKSVDLKEIVSNMELIKASASIYRDKYIDETIIEVTDTNETKVTVSNNFIGTHQNPDKSDEIIIKLLGYSNKNQLGDDRYYWFKLEQKDLDTLGIDIQLKNEIYFINYQTLEVAYCKNEKDENQDYKGILARKQNKALERYYYFYSDIKNLKTDEVRN